MFLTKADIKLLVITAFGGALALGIASIFQNSRAWIGHLLMQPVPLAMVLALLVFVVGPLFLVVRNRRRQLLKLQQEFAELQERADQRETDRKKRAAVAQASLSMGKARRGGFVDNW